MAQLLDAWHDAESPVVRLHLRDEDGAAVTRDVRTGDSYFYAQVAGADLGRLVDDVNRLRETALRRANPAKCVGACCQAGGRSQPCLREQQSVQGGSFITRCLPVEAKSVIGYGEAQFMWRVHVRFPWNVRAVSWAVSTVVEREGGRVALFEVGVDCVARFMVDRGLVGMGWLARGAPARLLDRQTNAPLVSVALDIECMATRPGVFCSADVDPM